MIRVFPRKNNATPTDEKVYLTGPPLTQLEDREVNVSCTFTWDKSKAESLAEQWEKQGYNVKLGGPAYGDRGEEFILGRYISYGYTITSRGYNNHCWYCHTWKREGKIRELKIKDGWIHFIAKDDIDKSEEMVQRRMTSTEPKIWCNKGY